MVALNGSYASPLANAQYLANSNEVAGGFLSRIYGLNSFSLIATVFLMLVVYDQCKLRLKPMIRPVSRLYH